jgi:hypothetical protein
MECFKTLSKRLYGGLEQMMSTGSFFSKKSRPSSISLYDLFSVGKLSYYTYLPAKGSYQWSFVNDGIIDTCFFTTESGV